MKSKMHLSMLAVLGLVTLSLGISSQPPKVTAQNNSHDPTWWSKYEFIRDNGGDAAPLSTTSTTASGNVDVSNECGPQSETFITLNPNKPRTLAAGSNEIFRLPMRGYYSTNAGGSWGGVDLPLPPAKGANGTDFGSDPTLAFDTQGNVFYGYIVVYFGNGSGINGTEIAVARSIGGGVRVATSSDHGASFSVTRADDPSGPGRSIGASPAVGPNGELYVAWNDYVANAIVFNSSYDAGRSWGVPITISQKTLPFDIGIPAESFRGALVYPSLDVDRSNGPHRGRVYCSWMDLTPANVTDIFISYSDNNGMTWSTPTRVPDQFTFPVDRFNHWMSIDPGNGNINVAFYDTRNDTTGLRYQTDYYLARSTDGGVSFPGADIRVSTVSSNEHDCNGIFPCLGINYGNQQGDYEGLVSFNGVSYPIWTDSRRQLAPSSGCRNLNLME